MTAPPTKNKPPVLDETDSDGNRPPRCTATVWYRQDGTKLLDVEHLFEELYQLHDLIENGPNWFAIDRFEIRFTSPIPNMTLEYEEQHLR